MNYTYILKCKDGSLYTGWTNDLEQRVAAHNTGKGAKYTKARRPVELVYFEEFETKEQAMKREYAIKQMARKDKLELVRRKEKADEQTSILSHFSSSFFTYCYFLDRRFSIG